MPQIKTSRLKLRTIRVDDAAFYLKLINEPSWHQYIGDRGIRTLTAAEAAIISGPIDMQNRLGFSLYVAELNDGHIPIGLCGLLKRDYLEDPDLGYAFLPQYWGQGYANEAASAVLQYAKEELSITRILATTDTDNQPSMQLLEKLGFCFSKKMMLDKELNLFSLDL
jgi:RimJ/RimL family protein N-acetyltransferase